MAFCLGGGTPYLPSQGIRMSRNRVPQAVGRSVGSLELWLANLGYNIGTERKRGRRQRLSYSQKVIAMDWVEVCITYSGTYYVLLSILFFCQMLCRQRTGAKNRSPAVSILVSRAPPPLRSLKRLGFGLIRKKNVYLAVLLLLPWTGNHRFMHREAIALQSPTRCIMYYHER